MGIRDLWLALSPACQTRTLTQLTVREGFESARRADHCLRIGIDSSIWMYQAQTAITYSHGRSSQFGENPALRILFYRLCRLLTLPIIPIFVFDGPERPPVKRGVQVKSRIPHTLTAGFKAFIEAFGFYWYEAPGEADADLAELNKRNFVDAIISEDSDVMVYGARTVIRMENTRKTGDLVNIFDSQQITNNPRVQLTHEGLFFMAILCGGDYSPSGLPGCGWKTALLLSRTALGKSLFVAASTSSSREQLQDFIRGWRSEFLNLLMKDPESQLGKRYPNLAREVGQGFPSIDTLLLYARPITSWTNGPAPNASAWTLAEPNLPKIASLAEKYFSWGSSDKTLANRFRDNVWPGIAIRFCLLLPDLHDQLVSYAQNNSVQGGYFTHANILRIKQEKIGPGGPATNSNVAGYTVEISTTMLLQYTGIDLEDDVQMSVARSEITKANIWIPAPILSAVLPAMVHAFRVRRRLPEQSPSVLYQPILRPLSDVQAHQLISLGPQNEQSPPAGPSTSRSTTTLTSHGDSISDPIILDEFNMVEDLDSGVVESTSAQDDLNSPVHLPDGRIFLGHIDLC